MSNARPMEGEYRCDCYPHVRWAVHFSDERNMLTDSVKFIGLDVHRDTISAAVLNERQAVDAVSHSNTCDCDLGFSAWHPMDAACHLEEGTHSAWLHDLLVRRVARLVVSDPRKNALLKWGNKGDLIDAGKLQNCCGMTHRLPCTTVRQCCRDLASYAQLYDAD